MIPVAVNDRWPVLLPEHRARRPEWPWHESHRFEAMHTALPAGAVLWDVGAELGDHAAVYASWGCRLVLIEPNPGAWPCLAATLEANGATGAIDAWCWSFVADVETGELGPARFGTTAPPWPPSAVGECTDRAGMAHLSGRPDPDPYPEQPVTTIDALVAAGAPAPYAMTIDVEGAELKVIRGAERTIAEHRPKIWLSVHPELLTGYGDDPAEIQQVMTGHGYRGRLLAVDHEEHWEWMP